MDNLEFWLPLLLGLAGFLALAAIGLWTSAVAPNKKPSKPSPSPSLPQEEHYRALAYRLAHDYSTPLQTLQFGLINVLDQLPEEEIGLGQHITILMEEVTHLVYLTEEAKRQVRLEHPERSVIRQPLDLPRLCQDVIAAALPRANERGVDLAYVGVPGHPIAFGDRAQIREVVVNLVDNGIKHADPERGQVRLEVTVDDQMVQVSVSDNGRGIPSTILRHLGDKPFPPRDTEDQHGSGTGLGLYNAKHIIKEHGGSFAVRNLADGGANFTFWLPLYGASRA